MRCDACKHWSQDEEDRRKAGGLVVRRCGRAPQWWDATQWTEDEDQDDPWGTVRALLPEWAGTKMFVQDGSDYRADLYTAADFFCAHFTQS